MAEEPVFTKAILDANKGITNIIEADVIREDLLKVIDKIFNTLKKHYGPLSEFAALGSRDPLTNTKFTKDGINIVRAIEFASPQEDWIRKTVAFVGERVEASIGDGTTSAMMFTCAMMKHMMQTIDQIKPISYTKLRNSFNTVVDLIEDLFNGLTYGPNEVGEDTPDSERVHNIVYNQVYTASHGDIELAEAMAKLYETTPSELWDKMIYERLGYETDKRFKVVYTRGQYQMQCDVMMNGMLNQEFCTWFKHDDCTLMVMNNPIMMDTDAYEYFCEYIEESVTPEHPLVVLCHSNIATDTYQDLVARLNDLAPTGKKVAIFHVNTTMGDWNPDVNDFRSLHLLCGADLTKMRRTQNRNEVVTVEHAKVEWRNKTLTLDNLYEVPEEYKDEPRRHLAIDGKHLHFTDYLAAVKKYAEGYSKLPATKINREMTTLMYRTYAKLMYTKVGCVQIGGSVHDNVALIDIVDDCVRASARALRKGVTFGNNKALYIVLRVARNRADTEDWLKDDKVAKWLIQNMLLSLEDMAVAQMELLYPGKKLKKTFVREFIDYWFTHTTDVLEFNPENSLDDQCLSHSDEIVSLDGKPGNISAAKESLDWHMEQLPSLITQPVDTDISMLKRFGEVALKFALSGRIIISNSAYVGDERKSR